jgi:PAS domain S-box-containing protein
MSNKPLLVSFYADPPFFTRNFVNDEYCKFFDVKSEQVLGRSCLDSTPENNLNRVRKKLVNCIQKDAVLESVEASIKSDGTTAVIRWIDTPVKDNKGHIIKIVAVGIPMQDRRKSIDRRQTF